MSSHQGQFLDVDVVIASYPVKDNSGQLRADVADGTLLTPIIIDGIHWDNWRKNVHVGMLVTLKYACVLPKAMLLTPSSAISPTSSSGICTIRDPCLCGDLSIENVSPETCVVFVKCSLRKLTMGAPIIELYCQRCGTSVPDRFMLPRCTQCLSLSSNDVSRLRWRYTSATVKANCLQHGTPIDVFCSQEAIIKLTSFSGNDLAKTCPYWRRRRDDIFALSNLLDITVDGIFLSTFEYDDHAIVRKHSWKLLEFKLCV